MPWSDEKANRRKEFQREDKIPSNAILTKVII